MFEEYEDSYIQGLEELLAKERDIAALEYDAAQREEIDLAIGKAKNDL